MRATVTVTVEVGVGVGVGVGVEVEAGVGVATTASRPICLYLSEIGVRLVVRKNATTELKPEAILV